MSVRYAPKAVTVHELRENLATYLAQAGSGQPVSIVQDGQPPLVLIRETDVDRISRTRQFLSDLEDLIETYEILADDELMDDIRRSEQDIAAGRYVTLDELKAELGF
ncbi:MAG TPA: type II toxin-antitoxin system prevent-host-death family antitoxin [Anaerolineae bacterium]|nr:type II toxin-antitoxin system prevent-host-death family antitoxin [Anaerolineae bacterium]